MNNKVSQNADRPLNNALWLPTCHSTNSYALDLIRKREVEEGWMVYTYEQQNGRGQAGNSWESEPGKNLTFSVVYKPVYLYPRNQFQLNMAVSLAIVEFLEGLGVKACIKWPNDIYVGVKKIAGVLIENQLRGIVFRHSVIGIGINVNQAIFETSGATSLIIETGATQDLITALFEIREKLRFQMQRLEAGMAETISKEYHELLYLRNAPAKYSSQGHEFEAVLTGVDHFGKLVLKTAHGTESFGLKEIVFVRT